MIDKTCAWCAAPFGARTVTQRFCSKRCAGLHQHRDRPKPASPRPPWGNRPPVDREHRKLRAAMLPAALGAPCPARVSPECVGSMSDPRRMQLDHIVARALGGLTTAGNVRLICGPCNHYLGSKLGGATTTARRNRTARPAPPRTLPKW